ncbi:SPOR domain-containing protein [Ramlibacter sp. MMS24-I3-19]|uniref:SPOR domain-containing protein n=1 Tax=Ramlibacter sp. MMS24-I3-19 TaxID=3416606 RepID=UPI003D02A7B5
MLRLLVLLLLLANALYFAWAQGQLQPLGLAPVQQSEPNRVAQQIKPQAVRELSAEDVRKIETGARSAECLQAGPIDDTAVAPVTQALAGWPAGSWTLVPVSEPARWIVYMGKYPSPDNVAKKKSELRQIGVTFEPVANPELEPGLSLGGFPTQAEANQLLERLAARGVHTAHVVQERPEVKGQQLTLPAVNDDMQGRLDELRTALAGKTLRPCR